jgi:hypothetical protein
MERFDVHVAAESQRSLTTKNTKNTEKILFGLRDLCDLCGEKLINEKVRDGEDTIGPSRTGIARESRALPGNRIVIKSATI